MREESQLDDMRAAIRGDFDRLAARRGGQEPMQAPEPEPVLEDAEEPAQPAEGTVEGAVEEPPPRSFLARLLGL